VALVANFSVHAQVWAGGDLVDLYLQYFEDHTAYLDIHAGSESALQLLDQYLKYCGGELSMSAGLIHVQSWTSRHIRDIVDRCQLMANAISVIVKP
jgi:hypothetical protein